MKDSSDMKKRKNFKRTAKKDVFVKSGDTTGGKLRQRGIWKRFFHTYAVAKIPIFSLLLYVVINVIQGRILVLMPQVNANFFAGDASVQSVTKFIAVELTIMVLVQVVLYINYHVRAKTNRNLRNVLWGKILKLKPSYFDKVSSNTLISRITVDSDSVNEFLMDIVLEIIFQVYMLILTIREMSTISIKAGLVLLAFMPLSIVYSFVMGRITLKINNSLKFKLSDLTAYLSDLLSCLPLLKAFNRQGYENRRGREVVNDYYFARKKMIFLDYVKAILSTIVGIGPEIAIILFGIKMLGDGTVDAAGWYMFYLYAGTFIAFVNTLGSAWQNAKGLQGTLNKISDILYEEEEGISEYVNEIVESGDILFDNITFGYEDTSVFENISFTIPKNKITAIIGYSGSGKSTLLKLLERIYEPQDGRILTQGKNIAKLDIRLWRKGIAYVSQNTPMLSGTIKDNILYGIDHEVSDAKIMEAAKLANADEFILECANGLDYEVGQFGTRLSGGQRQKISLARAILMGSEILVLDEPTSSLDMIAANEVLQTIKKITGTRTIIIVTHDAKAIRCADHIVVVGKDHTIASGTENELMKTSEFLNHLMKA